MAVRGRNGNGNGGGSSHRDVSTSVAVLERAVKELAAEVNARRQTEEEYVGRLTALETASGRTSTATLLSVIGTVIAGLVLGGGIVQLFMSGFSASLEELKRRDIAHQAKGFHDEAAVASATMHNEIASFKDEYKFFKKEVQREMRDLNRIQDAKIVAADKRVDRNQHRIDRIENRWMEALERRIEESPQ